jgi:hypothetical protein
MKVCLYLLICLLILKNQNKDSDKHLNRKYLSPNIDKIVSYMQCNQG